jgi:hypothetical protein
MKVEVNPGSSECSTWYFYAISRERVVEASRIFYHNYGLEPLDIIVQTVFPDRGFPSSKHTVTQGRRSQYQEEVSGSPGQRSIAMLT